MWVVCKYKSPSGPQHPVDRDPPLFYDVKFFDDEVEALRHANATRGKALPIRADATLDDLYFERPTRIGP